MEWGEARRLELFADVDVPTPDVEDWLMPIWRAWHRLNLDRPWYGGGLGPVIPGRIPWRDVRDWAGFHGMSGEDFRFLDSCIVAMDGVFLEIHAARAAASAVR